MFASEIDQASASLASFGARSRRANGALAATDPAGRGVAIRTMDILIAGAALIFLCPLLVVVFAAVRLSDGGPGIFAQNRVGFGGKRFRCFKFRSMVVNADAHLAELLNSDPDARAEWMRDQKLQRDPRITRLGLFLRRSSIDELPQLINVLKGDMSIVGPRPIIESEVVRYGRYFADYTMVKPGLTGLWQVSGRNHLSYRRRVALDVSYVRNQTFMLNVKIVAMTVPAVLLSKGSW